MTPTSQTPSPFLRSTAPTYLVDGATVVAARDAASGSGRRRSGVAMPSRGA
jgi:hypothetical protein